MNYATRLTLILTMWTVFTTAVIAQETTTASTAESATPAEAAAPASTSADVVTERASSHRLREEFNNLLNQKPPELGRILALDPTLLSNEAYLAGYPDLAQFIAANPEVRRNPGFYLSSFEDRRPIDPLPEVIAILGIWALVLFVLTWIIRTVIEQKRWSRLSSTQAEVHNKILDRFATSEELMAYIKTPAGTKFLESAPIPLHAEQPVHNAPLARIMWSIQLGVIIASAGIGGMSVANRFDQASSHGIFAMGVITLCIGAGFVLSAIVSLFLSRRFGMWSSSETGTVR